MSNSLDRADYLTWLEHASWIRVSARAIIPNPQHSHILVERNDWIDYAFFNFIGGGVEVGETLQECIARELSEETDARIQSARYLFIVENFFSQGGKTLHALEHYFLIHLDRANITPRNDGVHFQWLPIADLPQTDLRPSIVRDAIANNTYRDTHHLILRQT